MFRCPPRAPLAATAFAGVLAVVVACKHGSFKGRKAPDTVAAHPPEKSPNEVDKTRPGTTDPTREQPEANPPLPPGKIVVLELQPAPPESWWNNCVEVIYKGQIFDGGCSKTGGGLKSLVIPVAEQDACAALAFQVKTFFNQGDTCRTREAQGLPCEGPYGSTPGIERLSTQADASPHFRWERAEGVPDSTVSFEDQPKANLDAATANPARTSELGIDFDDVVIHVKPKGVSVVVQQAQQGQKGAAAPTCN